MADQSPVGKSRAQKDEKQGQAVEGTLSPFDLGGLAILAHPLFVITIVIEKGEAAFLPHRNAGVSCRFFMKLTLLPETLAVCRLAPDEDIPHWALTHKNFLSVTYTLDELSIVCPEAFVPPYIQCEKHWRAFKVEGPLNFSLTGVLASLATPLAAGNIPLFTISTFDTDYILVRERNVAHARKLLEPYGHTFA